MRDKCAWKREILRFFDNKIVEAINALPTSVLHSMTEIRVSSSGIVSVTEKSRNIILKEKDGTYIYIDENKLNNLFTLICEGSLYKYENQIRNGFITIPGGHRIGFCGTAVYDSGKLITIKNISAISIRISRQIINAAREIIGYISNDNKIYSALIVSEPGGGKTTILCDLARLISNSGKRVAVIDERSEISAVFQGKPSKDIGELTFVYDSYLKGEGMINALRTMSPQVIICDEIGSKRDADAMLEAMNAGVPVITSAHATTEEELYNRPQIEKLIDCGAIDKLVFLKGNHSPGSVDKVITVNNYDEDNWNNNDIN